MDKFNNGKKAGKQQGANVSKPVQAVYKIWKVAFAALKILAGAAATVGLVCLVCLFVFVNIVAGYLLMMILSGRRNMHIDCLKVYALRLKLNPVQ